MPKTKKTSYAKRRAIRRANEKHRIAVMGTMDSKTEYEKGNIINGEDTSNNDNIIDRTNDDSVIVIDSQFEEEINKNYTDGDICREVEMIGIIDTDIVKRISDLNLELDDRCVNAFLSVLADNTSFRPQDPIFYQATRWYQPVKTNRDIQILYGGEIGSDEIGHWTCVYFDGFIVHVYDTLHRSLLEEHHVILRRLYSTYTVKYERIQMQPDGTSCGVFAAAIATSIALGIDPSGEEYFVDINERIKSTYSLRCHLLKVLETRQLLPFPTVGRDILVTDELREDEIILGEFDVDVLTIVDKECQAMIADSIEINTDDIDRQIMQDKQQTYASVCRSGSLKTVNVSSMEEANLKPLSKKNICHVSDIKKKTLYSKNKANWWAVHKDEVNEKRRIDYEENKVQRRYDYNTRYSANRELNNTRQREKYAVTAEVKKIRERNNYITHVEAKRKYGRDKYNSNPEAARIRERYRYSQNLEAMRIKKKDRYDRNPELKMNSEKLKYVENPAKKKLMNKNSYRRNKMKRIVSKQSIYSNSIISSNSIVRKYRRLDKRRNTMQLLASVEKSIVALSLKIDKKSLAKSRIEAQKIVKWCMYTRGNLVFRLKTILANSKRNAELCLMRAAKVIDIDDRIGVLCGESKHTGSTESYFADTAYNDMNVLNKSIITTAEGKICNILTVCESTHVKKSWHCDSEMCVKPDLNIIDRLEIFLQVMSSVNLSNIRNHLKDMNVCSVKNNSNLKLGHSESCYSNRSNCKAKLLPMQILSAHYPRVRYFVRQVNAIIKIVREINAIDDGLKRADLEYLKKMSAEAEAKSNTYRPDSSDGISTDEDLISLKYKNAFESLTKRSMDVPLLACVSCEKLCCRRDVVNINKLKKPLTGIHWSNMIAHLEKVGNNSGFVCNYCLDKFRGGKIPATCVLNQMDVGERPVVISSMNDYEKLLIQRAKAFQTVHRMGTVMKKNIPQRCKIQKVKGRTFHLPLPLNETIKKLPAPTDAINIHHELIVLVCGIPNKSNSVWSKLVDVKKIYEALSWLKTNNQLYRAISLPARPESLLEAFVDDVEIQIERKEVEEDVVFSVPECDGEILSVPHAAMLTQVSDIEKYCEQFTIYPIHEGRDNKSDSYLYQLLNVNETPLNDWDKNLDVMCFPDLYPNGVNGQHQSRTVQLRDYDYIKCRLMSKNSSFRLNQQYIFYLLHQSNLRQLKAGIFHKMNVINPRDKINARSYLDMLTKGQLEGNLTTVFARLRNTEQYWRRPRNNLRCMVENYGPATWFLTISPSEWMWDELAEYIREVNGDAMKNMSTSELVAADPVSTSRFIDNKFNAMLIFICSKDNPIGEVIHYFWRREYQGRGMQHFHLLVWIKDAPVIGESSNEDVADFILKHATCKIPDKRLSPTLYRRVNTHQRHRHNDYCLRNKKNKKGLYSRVCRFGFPRSVTDKIVIRDVGISIAGRKKLKTKSRLYDLPRAENETCINDYNPVVLCAWEGNMDLQFIGEKSTLLNAYCTQYTTKTESAFEVQMINDINSTKSLHSRLWGVALRSLVNRECGALEAADTLLGIPLYGTDPATTIKWLDINQVRSRKVKSYKTVQALDPECTDIFFPVLIDDYYPNRPEALGRMNLYDFAKWYDVTRVKPVDASIEIYELSAGLYLKKRRQPYLINHFRYNVNVQPDKYFYGLLIMFKPWRDTDELKHGSDSYTESFEICKAELVQALKYHERALDIQKGLDYIALQVAKHLEDNNDDKSSKLSRESKDDECNPIGFQPVEADIAMQEFNCVDDKLETVDIEHMISKLNIDQRRIFDNVTGHLNIDGEIMRLFVSGAGGTGKSFLIKTIRCWIKQTLGKATAVTAPTGLAAFNIDGLTIHRLFQLPIEHGGTPKYKGLSDQVLKILRQEMKDVVLFIIDEVSMISNVTLAHIHLRLSEIFDTKNTHNGWFGNKHILLLGDLLQLPPVNDDSPFVILSKDKTHKYFGSLGMINLWSHLFAYDELMTNMRQQNDSSYKEILDRIRIGVLTSKDLEVLQSRQLKFVGARTDERLKELCDYINRLPISTVCLFSTRNQCEKLNSAMLANLTGDEILLRCEDTVDCAPYLRKKIDKLLSKDDEDSSRTAGLAKTITVKIGAKVMVRRNIDVTIGIVNGTIGVVTSVNRSVDTGEVVSLKIELASGENYTIEKISTKFEIMNGAFIFRKQFPLSLSYGITIHKSQGLSLSSAVMDIGNTVFTSGQVYVALSRVTSIQGLHVINFDPHSIKVQESALVEYNRLRRAYRPDLATIEVSRKPMIKIKDTVWSIINSYSDKQVQDAQIYVAICADDSLVDNNVNGMENSDSVSCYANATIQCLFNCKNIIKRLNTDNKNEIEDPLMVLARIYNTISPKLNSLAVREFADKRFFETIQQDAAEFLNALCASSEIIRDAIEHRLITTIRCNNCGIASEKYDKNYIATLHFDKNTYQQHPTNIQDLINKNYDKWTIIKSLCKNCKSETRLQKISISDIKEIFVVQLMLFNYENDRSNKITDLKINGIPTTKVSLDSKTYKVSSAIFHHGTSTSSGHYTAVINSKGNWLRVDDMQVQKTNWPRGSKDVYIFILSKVQ